MFYNRRLTLLFLCFLSAAYSARRPRGTDNNEVSEAVCAACRLYSQTNPPPNIHQQFQLRTENEMKRILARLKLETRPNISVTSSDLPAPLLEEVRAAQPAGPPEYTYDPLYATTKGIYLLADKPPAGKHRRKRRRSPVPCNVGTEKPATCFSVTTTEDLNKYHIENATLWFYKIPGKTSPESTFKIIEYDVTLEVFAKSFTHSSRSGWINVDVTDLIARWKRDVSSQPKVRTLQITCASCQNGRTPVADREKLRPFIQLSIKSEVEPRRRRHEDSRCIAEYDRCCLQTFYVNFTEIGWGDWIIQPEGYFANYCHGNCRQISGTNHGAVQIRAKPRKFLDGPGTREDVDTMDPIFPCCSPSKMSSLDIIYALADGDVRKKRLENMIVDSCDC